MNFLDKQLEKHKIIVEIDNDNNDLAITQLPKDIVDIINIKDLGQKDGLYIKRIVYTKYSNISYDELVNGMVRDKYSESAEFAILRKAMTLKTDEFTEYNTYVEECKVKAKEWISQRDGI